MAAPAPAPACTRAVTPWRASSRPPSGGMATRCSLSLISVGTPTTSGPAASVTGIAGDRSDARAPASRTTTGFGGAAPGQARSSEHFLLRLGQHGAQHRLHLAELLGSARQHR